MIIESSHYTKLTFKNNLVQFVENETAGWEWFTELQDEVEREEDTVLLSQLTEVSTVEAVYNHCGIKLVAIFSWYS